MGGVGGGGFGMNNNAHYINNGNFHQQQFPYNGFGGSSGVGVVGGCGSSGVVGGSGSGAGNLYYPNRIAVPSSAITILGDAAGGIYFLFFFIFKCKCKHLFIYLFIYFCFRTRRIAFEKFTINILSTFVFCMNPELVVFFGF